MNSALRITLRVGAAFAVIGVWMTVYGLGWLPLWACIIAQLLCTWLALEYVDFELELRDERKRQRP